MTLLSGIHPSAIIGTPAEEIEYLQDEEEVDLLERMLKFQPRIHPTVRVGPLTQIDSGARRPTIIQKDTFVHGQVHIAGGVQIGSSCIISSGTVIGTDATIGDNVYIGMNASIFPDIKIGSHVVIKPGTLVEQDIADRRLCVLCNRPHDNDHLYCGTCWDED